MCWSVMTPTGFDLLLRVDAWWGIMWEDRVGVGVVLYCTCSPGMVALCVCTWVRGLFFHNPSLLLLLYHYLFWSPLAAGISFYGVEPILMFLNTHIFLKLYFMCQHAQIRYVDIRFWGSGTRQDLVIVTELTQII